MEKRVIVILVISITLFLIANVSAIYTEESSKISFGHALRVQNISAPQLSPGESGILKVNLKNNAEYSINDVNSRLTLPSQLQFIEDVNEVRIAEIKSGDTKEIEYRIIALPTATEGIYAASLIVNYITHFGVNAFNVGEQNQDNYTLGIIIKSNPSIFVQLDSGDIYKGENIGDINFKFVNNGTSNIKFLTVNLVESNDYEIISDNKNYIGDLDSDDFQTATFKIKLKAEKEMISLPIMISYRDSMNNYYSENLETNLKIRSASELGKSDGNYLLWIIIILAIIVCVVCYFYIKNMGKKRKI